MTPSLGNSCGALNNLSLRVNFDMFLDTCIEWTVSYLINACSCGLLQPEQSRLCVHRPNPKPNRWVVLLQNWFSLSSVSRNEWKVVDSCRAREHTQQRWVLALIQPCIVGFLYCTSWHSGSAVSRVSDLSSRDPAFDSRFGEAMQ